MSSPMPSPPEVTEKTKRYDRQLRLWGDHGQKHLESSKVCLINATALGTEILKSLVLPGIGSFTIVDDKKVTQEDIGSNFFLDSESVDMSRAGTATQWLLELNSDVSGDYIEESVDHILSHNPEFFQTFDVVIAASLSEKSLLALSEYLWEYNVALIMCASVGFLGYLRIQIREHTIIESHPDHKRVDLRLTKPWPELKEYLQQFNLNELSAKDLSFASPIAILYFFLNEFQKLYQRHPQSRDDQRLLKDLITKSLSNIGDASIVLEPNVKESLRYVHTACIDEACDIPKAVREILDDSKCRNLTTSNASTFWVLCAALRNFYDTECQLPVSGTLPDMHTDTNSYVALQQLYFKQHRLHAEQIYRSALQLARSLSLPTEHTPEESDALQFCRHVHNLSLQRGTKLANGHAACNIHLSADPDSLLQYYIALKGAERFVAEYNIWPGHTADHVELDVSTLKSIVNKMLADWGCNATLAQEERVHEICRYGGAELHSVSSVLGGCAAQEVIKLITHQYKPIDNTFIYDAMTGSSATYAL